MKISGIIFCILIVLFMSYFLIGIGTIIKNGTSITKAPGTVARLKLFLSKNSAETAEESSFPELLPKHIAWNTAEQDQLIEHIINTALSLGYELQKNDKKLEQASNNEQPLHFTYTTKIFKFTDDLYVNIKTNDDKGFIIHAKSSSRTGRADFGANIANIRNLFERL